jgi:dihydrofolate reductase
MARPRCSVFIATSLDGYIAREDGGIDWLDRVQLPGEDYGFAAFFDTIDALVMGRGTYDTVIGFPEWAYTGKRVYVLTHRPAEPRHGEVFLSGTADEVLERAGRDGVQHAYIDGGVVIGQFMAARLIHHLTISIIPVVLGGGRPLFGGGEGEHALELEDVRTWKASGLTQLRYRAAIAAPGAGPR